MFDCKISRTVLIILLCFIPTVAVAEVKPDQEQRSIPGAYRLFNEQVAADVYELASGALATWRSHAERKPALVLFSKHPFLTPLHSDQSALIKDFVLTSSTAELVQRAQLQTADPVFLPPQAVSAAIASGLISELVFVEPTSKKISEMSLNDFQQRAFNAGFVTAEEALAMTLENGVIRGMVRGIPFRSVHPEALPALAGPVLLHIDLGYFDELYVNAVKTPAFPMIYQVASALRDAGWPTLAVTLSYSNHDAEFPLENRFMITTLADILYQPALLEGGVPASWSLRANALYAADMFAETTAQDLVLEASQANPDDAAAFYDLSLVLFRQKQNEQAFAALDQAVKLDSGYALAYLSLVETAMDLGQSEKALELMKKAAGVFPGNPLVRIGLADLLIRFGRGGEALPLLQELQQLPWSPVYHPGIPDLLKEMLEVAKE